METAKLKMAPTWGTIRTAGAGTVKIGPLAFPALPLSSISKTAKKGTGITTMPQPVKQAARAAPVKEGPKILSSYELVPLANAVKRADNLENWAYTEWKLKELSEPKTETYKKRPCWVCGKKTYTRDNPVYIAAKERERKNHFGELTKLHDSLLAFQSRFRNRLNQMGAGLPATAAAEKEYIKKSLNAIYKSVEEAETQKQLNSEKSISAQVSDTEEAISIINASLATIDRKKEEAARQAEQAKLLARQQAEQKAALAKQQAGAGTPAAVPPDGQGTEDPGPGAQKKTLITVGILAASALGVFIYLKKRGNNG